MPWARRLRPPCRQPESAASCRPKSRRRPRSQRRASSSGQCWSPREPVQGPPSGALRWRRRTFAASRQSSFPAACRSRTAGLRRFSDSPTPAPARPAAEGKTRRPRALSSGGQSTGQGICSPQKTASPRLRTPAACPSPSCQLSSSGLPSLPPRPFPQPRRLPPWRIRRGRRGGAGNASCRHAGRRSPHGGPAAPNPGQLPPRRKKWHYVPSGAPAPRRERLLQDPPFSVWRPGDRGRATRGAAGQYITGARRPPPTVLSPRPRRRRHGGPVSHNRRP